MLINYDFFEDLYCLVNIWTKKHRLLSYDRIKTIGILYAWEKRDHIYILKPPPCTRKWFYPIFLTFYSSGDLYLNYDDVVQNVPGTGNKKPPGRSDTWKQYYLRNGQRYWPGSCCIRDCTEPADGAGHVRVEGRRGVYIVPMCDRRHNTAQNVSWLHVKEGTTAMPVEMEEERGRCVISWMLD